MDTTDTPIIREARAIYAAMTHDAPEVCEARRDALDADTEAMYGADRRAAWKAAS